jgi:hypothetical protein
MKTGNMPRLYRERDGEGYIGSRVESIDPETGTVEFVPGPVVGKMFLVGTMTGGMFTSRDWWRTNIVTEILEDTEEHTKFMTKSGSTYVFEK